MTTRLASSVAVLDQADDFTSRLDFLLAANDQDAALHVDDGGWRPGDPLYSRPGARESDQYIRPLYQLLSTGADDVYLRCEDCEVDWEGDEPCWFCGKDCGPDLVFNSLSGKLGVWYGHLLANQISWVVDVPMRGFTHMVAEDEWISLDTVMTMPLEPFTVSTGSISAALWEALLGIPTVVLKIEEPSEKPCVCGTIFDELYDPGAAPIERTISVVLPSDIDLSGKRPIEPPKMREVDYSRWNQEPPWSKLDKPATQRRRPRQR